MHPSVPVGTWQLVDGQLWFEVSFYRDEGIDVPGVVIVLCPARGEFFARARWSQAADEQQFHCLTVR